MPDVKPIRRAKTSKDWYSVSVDTLRGWALLLLLLAVAGGGYLLYRRWEWLALRRQSFQLINEDQALLTRLQDNDKSGGYRSELEVAGQSLQLARGEYARQSYREALASAKRGHNVLESIQDAALPGAAGLAHFIAIQGGVEFRRGEGGSWEEAHGRATLNAGDSVRTAEGGSAEIMFADGSLYTVRANTQFIVSPEEVSASGGPPQQSIRMAYGWVDLNTASHSSQVKTPGAVARVKEDSEAFVTYDQGSNRGRFGAFQGGMELATKGGLTRDVKEMQQVTQTGDLLSQPERLPGRPEPLEPADNLELDLGRNQTLALAWTPIPGSARYALQVSRSHLFADNLVNVENRVKTRATLGLRGEGTFYWRVAAFARNGSEGPWSKPARFRVASARGAGGERPTTPPELDLEDVKSYGSIYIVAGRSDPGCRVEINGEQVNVGVDGSFTKTVQLTREGWSFIEIRARDRWGNEALRRRRVFVESP